MRLKSAYREKPVETPAPSFPVDDEDLAERNDTIYFDTTEPAVAVVSADDPHAGRG